MTIIEPQKKVSNKRQAPPISESMIAMLKRQEGLRLKVYSCPAGKLTIGYGRNLEDRGITLQEADYLLQNDILFVRKNLEKNIMYFNELPLPVQEVLINMGFQLGIKGLLKFKNTLFYISKSLWDEASIEMLDSRWAKQTPSIAKELSEIIRKQGG
jgi:lysozyme